MLLSEFIKQSTAALQSIYPSAEAAGIVSYLVCDTLGVERYAHILNPQLEIQEDRLPLLQSRMQRLCSSEPIQYVLGKADFCGHVFRVEQGVLIPRPETELLVDWARKALPAGGRAIDLCTGSGCIALSLAAATDHCRIWAVDISRQALQIASRQPLRDELSLEVTFLLADILDPSSLSSLEPESFDLLTSNPPYVMDAEKALMRANVLDYEPHIALFVPNEDPLLFYRAVCTHAARLLRPGGKGIVEINETLGEQTAEVFSSAGFKNVEIMQDFFHKNRFVTFQK